MKIAGKGGKAAGKCYYDDTKVNCW